MVTPNRIALIVHGRYDESVADADTYPGMLLQRNAGGGVQGHAVAGGACELMVALEDALQGKDITQKVLSGSICPYYRLTRGDLVLMLLQTGQNVLAEAPLISAGDGTLMAGAGAEGDNNLYQIVAPSANISSTAAETAFSNGSYTIPAGFLQVGDVIHIHGRAVVSAQNSTNTHQVKVYLGSTVLADAGASALAAGNFAEYDVWMTIRSIGSGGKFIADVLTTVNPGGVNAQTPATITATTVDTTVGEAITVKSTASAASSGNVIALQEHQVDLQRTGGLNVIGYSQEAKDNSGGTGTSMFNNAMFIRVMIP